MVRYQFSKRISPIQPSLKVSLAQAEKDNEPWWLVVWTRPLNNETQHETARWAPVEESAAQAFSAFMTLQSGLRSWSRSRKESEVFGWSRIPDNTGSRIFLSDSGSPIGSFLYKHSSVGNSCTISFETFVETKISCCAPRFPLIANRYKIVNSQTSLTLC